MFRPLSTLKCRIPKCTSISVRNKIVYPVSLQTPAEKLKLWHKENKELFGSLLKTNKQKKKSLKSAKNKTRTNNSATTDDGRINNCASLFVQNALLNSYSRHNIKLLSGKMKQTTKNCVNLVGVLLNYNSVRGLKTCVTANAIKSSAVQSGYVSDDKILQIKQHQNDYAQQYPSVTLILNKTMTDESRVALEKWKQEKIAEIGEEEFNKYYQAQMAVGTKFHNTLKDYFTKPRSQLRIEKEVEGVWTSVDDVLKHISSPKAIESNVVHPVLKYRGIFDAIADYEEKPTLIEWKKSDRPRKSLSLTFDNPVQLAAYFGAVCNDLNYKHLNVRDALLVIAYTDGSKADAYHLSTDKLREHWAQWLIRLEDYMMKYGNDAQKQLAGGKRLFEEDIGNLQ